MQGRIIKGIAGFYYVYDVVESVIYECKAKGIFRKEKIKPLVGDLVEYEILDAEEKTGNIIRILPRKNELIRPAVANIDQALVVFAVKKPDPHFNLLDRFLVMMERQEIPVIICFNKKDIADEPEIESLEKTYEACGYRVIFASAREGENILEIKEALKGKTTTVAGPSGVGKSSLINEVLFKALGAQLNRMKVRPGKHDAIEGMEQLDKVIAIDQSPIGRTPRSNPATYTNLFNLIRDLFASTPDAKARGYGPGRFSFNTKGGRCEACGGDGMLKIEMHFLSDVYVPCEICRGKRYNRETLEVRYKGKNIADVLDMTVDEAWEFFSAVPAICDKLTTLRDVGLGYVKLGQPSTTLSGGEAQRVKLATELSRRATGRTVYILDEPTTGLHADDVRKLLEVLQRLTDGGNTVLVIEHNLDVIKCADYIIDLGPEGGVGGGTVVACGTPEEIAACPASYTGQYLKKYLK
mgnify:CR=1 FL=1